MAQIIQFGSQETKATVMKTIRRLIHGEIISAVSFVTLGFLALFIFFDIVAQLQTVSRSAMTGYQFHHALLYVSLLIPGHLYELLPLSVLIGSIFVMARFAQTSEFTILRTGGLGPWRAMGSLFKLGLLFVMLTFFLGDYVTPVANRHAQLLKAKFQGNITIGQTGAWLKEKQKDLNFAVNVAALNSDGQLGQVRIHAFDPDGRLAYIASAPLARIGDKEWVMENAQKRDFKINKIQPASIEAQQIAQWHWPTDISTEMVAAALLSPDRMQTLDLFQYMRHLAANGQNAQRYEIEFWRKVFYPLSCLVMLSLALPFAYLHFRSGHITGYVFGGVMAGISFYLLNNVFGFMGNLNNWQPWLTSAAPALIYSAISLATFWWLVLRQ
jgi:lipopolysaccharide export system permease protein